MNYKNRIIGTGTADPKTLKANALNWRKHPDAQRKAMQDVLGNIGWIQDVIINKTTGNLIDGHLRVETAIKNKEAEIPVKYVELTEDEEKVALATFDPISMMAEQDDDLLKQLLAGVDTEMDLSQFHDDYDKLMRPEHTAEELDAVPAVPKVAKTKRGDVYRLGDHVLMCGDSTSEDDVARLMQGEKADICFSSPPYNAGFGANLTKDNGRNKYTNGENDNKTRNDYSKFLISYIENANRFSEFNFCNIQMLANNKLSLFDVLSTYIDNLADIIIWDKTRSQPQLAENVLNSEFEFVFVFSENASRRIGTIPFHGNLKNIIHIDPKKNEYSDIHNAVFPIDLAKYFVSNFAKDSVMDLFGGTGTTLIACEETGRKCRMMELAPEYCDVIVERWEKLTGKKAELIA